MSITDSTATEAPAQPPRRPWHRRTWVRLTALAVAALIAASAGTAAALSSGHQPAAHRPAVAAKPAVPTPDQVLVRDGFTPAGSMTKQELINQAGDASVGQILQPLVNGTSSVGEKGDTGQIVIPITPAGQQVLNNPAMLHEIASSSGPGSTARFAGPYLVITSPGQSGPSSS